MSQAPSGTGATVQFRSPEAVNSGIVRVRVGGMANHAGHSAALTMGVVRVLSAVPVALLAVGIACSGYVVLEGQAIARSRRKAAIALSVACLIGYLVLGQRVAA